MSTAYISIPKRLSSIVQMAWAEDDGYFAMLKDGWVIDDCSGWREDTKAKLWAEIKDRSKRGSPL